MCRRPADNRVVNLNENNTPSGLGRLPIPPAARASECARVWKCATRTRKLQLASEKSQKRRCGRTRRRGTPRFGELTGLGTLRRDPHGRASAYKPILAACGARCTEARRRGVHLSREDCGLQRAAHLDHVPLLMLGRSVYLGHHCSLRWFHIVRRSQRTTYDERLLQVLLLEGLEIESLPTQGNDVAERCPALSIPPPYRPYAPPVRKECPLRLFRLLAAP